MRKNITWVVIIVLILAGALVVWLATQSKTGTTETQPVDAPNMVEKVVDSLLPESQEKPKTMQAQDIAGVDSNFIFVAQLPAGWEAEAIAQTEAISFFDPAAPGASNLEKSQIFVRSFSANDFLTLSTVTILSRESLTINGRPAVRYDIEKKAGVPNFAGQPAWRSGRHIVTDIRVSDANPSVFYVIAKRPDLDQKIYEDFLQNLQVTTEVSPVSLVPPIAEFRERITKKPFGIFITPETSPVQPERFSGWHTGADVEYGNVAGEVPVRAMADGKVVVSRTASGYGGVLVIQHEIKGQPVLGVYGHLKPASLAAVGKSVAAGEQIGVLGAGGTAETDGERKHLHFALLKGMRVDLRGYVQTENELSAWLNPLEAGI